MNFLASTTLAAGGTTTATGVTTVGTGGSTVAGGATVSAANNNVGKRLLFFKDFIWSLHSEKSRLLDKEWNSARLYVIFNYK